MFASENIPQAGDKREVIGGREGDKNYIFKNYINII